MTDETDRDGVVVTLTARERALAEQAGDSPAEYVRRAVALRDGLADADERLRSMTGETGRCPVCGEPVVRRVGDGESEHLQPCNHRVPAGVRYHSDG